MNLKRSYIEQVKNTVKNSLKKLGCETDDIVIEIPPQREFGDIALPMFKYSATLKMKPFDIASKIKEELEKDILIEKIDIKGPYLNLFLNKKIVSNDLIKEILSKKDNFGKQNNKNIKVVVEFSCPNTNKPLHLGH
ncbi:MAG TPA: arginine--tRNA ligase, partial [Spirochaetota bacterium]|nr:arginine--tRNA ligase [Spirochaetota bacterium]